MEPIFGLSGTTVAEAIRQGDLSVNHELSATNKSQIGCQILTYLVEHPEAQDTLEGIVEWWLLERQIKFQTTRVREALCELVSSGLVLEKKGSDSQTQYRINQARYKKIQQMVKREKR